MNTPVQKTEKSSLQEQMQSLLAFTLGITTSFFVSPFIIALTRDSVVPFAVSITGGVFDSATASFFWSACVYGGLFAAMTFFIHIKLTLTAARMISKLFDEEHPSQKKSGVGSFLKGVLFAFLALAAIGSLTGCKSENQQRHERSMQQDVLQHQMRLAEGAGRFELEKINRANAEATRKRTHIQKLESMAIAAEKAAQQAFHDLISNTITPLIALIAGIIGFVIFVWRFCLMREREAENRTKQAIVVAFAASMTPEERQQALHMLLNKPDIIDVKAIE